MNEALIQAAHDELMNMQPHIAELPKMYRQVIDSHVDMALAHLDAALSQEAPVQPVAQEETPQDDLASKLIDAWIAEKGRKIPWAKAIEIVAIVTKQSDAERGRLLHMGDDADGKCEMCGRSDAPVQWVSASEALYGFAAWLTCRAERSVFSAVDDAAPAAQLVSTYCEANGFPELREGWERQIKTPAPNPPAQSQETK